jgi:hypothetical protein
MKIEKPSDFRLAFLAMLLLAGAMSLLHSAFFIYSSSQSERVLKTTSPNTCLLKIKLKSFKD